MRLFKWLRVLSLIWYALFLVTFFVFGSRNLLILLAHNCAQEFTGNAQVQIQIDVVGLLPKFEFWAKVQCWSCLLVFSPCMILVSEV